MGRPWDELGVGRKVFRAWGLGSPCGEFGIGVMLGDKRRCWVARVMNWGLGRGLGGPCDALGWGRLLGRPCDEFGIGEEVGSPV